MIQYKGASRSAEINTTKRRKDVRRWGQKLKDTFESGTGVIMGLFAIPIIALLLSKVPLSGELMLGVAWLYKRRYVDLDGRGFDFPYRAPVQSGVGDGSFPRQKNEETKKLEWKKATGITYLAQDTETGEQVYSGDSDLRTHMLVLGTTGSGKPQGYHSNVLTPRGWRTMGSLRVGDIVCTPDGKTAKILKIFEQGIQDLWQLRTRDGRKAEGTGEHLWRVLIRYEDGREDAETVTTDRIRDLLAMNARVMVPVVKRKHHGAKFRSWVRIWKVVPTGAHLCRCIEIDHPQHLYVTDDNIVTHNTEFLLGLVFNALVQNTGCIYVDGKGDPKLQKEIFRLARYLGRECDLLIINFITSGRDFIEKQLDKVTNNMNLMGNTSSGMLIELIVGMMDDSGGGGDMWKGRAIMFVAALTRPLIYLRDKGFINLSPEKYLEYFELNVLEELVWEHNGRYGELFDVIVAPLRSYLTTLPGYSKAKCKKQEQKTLEQHGFIVMQLTRIFNDLTFNYGHIFKVKVGDVDFFDVVLNRRILVVLLPALELAPDSLRMLGKLIVGSIKQMMAGCLGNRVEGVVREIIDSRPTNAAVPFYCILDEYGYYSVIGFAVAPAQARSLGFAVVFAAQDFSSLKKSSAEEADATWENTNVRAVGRLTSGEESETWRRVQGASGQSSQAMVNGYERKEGTVNEKFTAQDNINIERASRLDYDDLAAQENGEFTLLIGKKEQGGKTGGVRVIRGMGFYTASAAPKEMRINDLIPVEAPEPADMPQNRQASESLRKSLIDGSFADMVKRCTKGDKTLVGFHNMFEKNHATGKPKLDRQDVSSAVLGWFLSGASGNASAEGQSSAGGTVPAVTVIPAEISVQQINVEKVLSSVVATIKNTPKEGMSPYSSYSSPYTSAVPVADDSDEEISIDTSRVTSLIQVTSQEVDQFRAEAMPILRSFRISLDEGDDDMDEDDAYVEIDVANRDKLLDAEMSATGQAFESLEEKFAAEDRISEMHMAIGTSTAYPAPPEPEPRSVGEMKLSLAQLAQRCREEVKDSLRE